MIEYQLKCESCMSRWSAFGKGTAPCIYCKHEVCLRRIVYAKDSYSEWELAPQKEKSE